MSQPRKVLLVAQQRFGDGGRVLLLDFGAQGGDIVPSGRRGGFALEGIDEVAQVGLFGRGEVAAGEGAPVSVFEEVVAIIRHDGGAVLRLAVVAGGNDVLRGAVADGGDGDADGQAAVDAVDVEAVGSRLVGKGGGSFVDGGVAVVIPRQEGAAAADAVRIELEARRARLVKGGEGDGGSVGERQQQSGGVPHRMRCAVDEAGSEDEGNGERDVVVDIGAADGARLGVPRARRDGRTWCSGRGDAARFAPGCRARSDAVRGGWWLWCGWGGNGWRLGADAGGWRRMATDFEEGDACLAEADEYPEVENGDERQTEGDEKAGGGGEVPKAGQGDVCGEDDEDGGSIRAVGVGRTVRRRQLCLLMVLVDVKEGVGEGVGGVCPQMKARRRGVVAGHGFAEVDVDGDLAALRLNGIQPAAETVAFAKSGGGGFAQHDFQPDGIRVGTATDDGNGVGLGGAQLGDVGQAPSAEAGAVAVINGEAPSQASMGEGSGRGRK